MKATCCCVTVWRMPLVKATCLLRYDLADTTSEGNVLLRYSLADATSEGDVFVALRFGGYH